MILKEAILASFFISTLISIITNKHIGSSINKLPGNL